MIAAGGWKATPCPRSPRLFPIQAAQPRGNFWAGPRNEPPAGGERAGRSRRWRGARHWHFPGTKIDWNDPLWPTLAPWRRHGGGCGGAVAPAALAPPKPRACEGYKRRAAGGLPQGGEEGSRLRDTPRRGSADAVTGWAHTRRALRNASGIVAQNQTTKEKIPRAYRGGRGRARPGAACAVDSI